MFYINKKFVALMVLLLCLTVGFFIFKNVYNKQMPKSAKLVFLLKNN